MASRANDDRHADGKGKKRKRQSKYLLHSGKKSTISAGVQGFLITCLGGKERQSIKEAISLLDLFSESPPTEGRKASEDLPSDCSGVESRQISEDVPAVCPADEARKVAEDVPDVCPASKAEDGFEKCPPSNSKIEAPQGSSNVEGNEEHESEDSEDSDSDGFGWVKCRRVEGCAEGSSKPTRSPCRVEYEQGLVEKGKKTNEKIGETSKGLDELLAAELEELRDRKKARFVGYETGCNGVIFVRMHSEKDGQEKGPKELAEAIVREAAASKQSRSRFCMRLLPIELTCYASTAEVLKVAEPLILRHFPKDKNQESVKFAVICEARANTDVNRMDFINTVAKMVPEPHSVDLTNPKKTILIQIVKTACAIGVVDDFKELLKYNLKQLTSTEVKAK